MGLMAGGASFSRFRVEGQLPPNYREELAGRIRGRGFRELEEHSDQERSVGWVNIMDPMDVEFRGEEFLKGGYVALALRVDVRRVPSKVLRQHTMAAERELIKKEGLTFLPRERRREIREQVRWRLLKRVLPISSIYEVAWNLKEGFLLLGSVQPAVCDLFQEHFHKTFDMKVIPLYPKELALSHCRKLGWDAQRLLGLHPWALKTE